MSRSWYLTGLALTGSRMSVLFLVVVAVALFARTALRPASLRWRWASMSMLAAGYAIGLIAVRVVIGDADTLARFGQDTLPLRLELWWQAWHISLQHPVLGVGIGQFPAAQYWVARAGPYTASANNCHNLVLNLAAEFGWPASRLTTPD